jgi:uncharacterized repeat protein (TIGR01451 family)/uncharacterized repeat protein (TIGR02543 family)
VVLTATASITSAFTGWSGDCSGTGITCTVRMSGDKDVTANFTRIYTVTVAKDGNGSGTVTSTPSGIDCGATCSTTFRYNTIVTLTASADTGSQFTGWSGACTGSNTCVTTIASAKNVTATFALITYTVAVAKDGNGAGSITSDPSGIDCGETCSTDFNYNTAVTLTASADTGSQFTGWSGACTADGLSCATTVTGTRDVTATFTLITYTVSVTKTGEGNGTITSEPAGIDCGDTCSADFNYNTVVTLTAAPITGSQAVGWAGDCSVDGLVCVTTVTGAREVTATFDLITTDLAVSQSVTRSTGIVTFTVVANNKGPSDADGSVLSDTIPSGLSNPQATCEAANGASCPASLMSIASVTDNPYSIYDTLPDFPNGGVVTYTISGGVGLLTQRLVNTAEIIPPNGVTDATEPDNTSEVITEYRVMFPLVLRSQ